MGGRSSSSVVHVSSDVHVRPFQTTKGPVRPARTAKGAAPGCGNRSLHGVLLGAGRTAADAEALDQRTEALDVLLGQVLQQAATLADQDQQTTTGVVVVLVRLEVLGQVRDALGEHRHLDLRRTGVTLGGRVLLHDRLLDFSVERHNLPNFGVFFRLAPHGVGQVDEA